MKDHFENKVIIEEKRYNELLKIENYFSGYSSNSRLIIINSFGYCKADLRILNSIDGDAYLADHIKYLDAQNRQLRDSLALSDKIKSKWWYKLFAK